MSCFNDLRKFFYTAIAASVVGMGLFLSACEGPEGYVGCDRISVAPSGMPSSSPLLPIVFIPSGFSATPEIYDQAVVDALDYLQSQNVFSIETPLAFYKIDANEHNPILCERGCQGIDRLVCCDLKKTKKVLQHCDLPHSQVIVIHNDPAYGGGGYLTSDVAAITIHPASTKAVAHELGHSLFDLVDEYVNDTGLTGYPNCELTKNSCSLWSDLIDAGFAGCVPNACDGGDYSIGQSSVMGQLGFPFHAVNERISCCVYAQTGSPLPSYCRRFSELPGGMGCGPVGGIAAEPLKRGYWITLENTEPGVTGARWEILESRFVQGGQSVRPLFVNGEGAGEIAVTIRDGENPARVLRFASRETVEVSTPDGVITRAVLPQVRDQITIFVPHQGMPEAGEGGPYLPGQLPAQLQILVNGKPVHAL